MLVSPVCSMCLFFLRAAYNKAREYLGLKPVQNFTEITKNKAVAVHLIFDPTHLQGMLENVYGTVDRIDAYVGTFAEDQYVLTYYLSVSYALTSITAKMLSWEKPLEPLYKNNSADSEMAIDSTMRMATSRQRKLKKFKIQS